MADTPNAKRAWTDAEKVTLLFSIIDSHNGAIDWKNVTLPEGRTQKACMHTIQHMRDVAKAGLGNAGVGKADGGLAPNSPTKVAAPKSPIKAAPKATRSTATGTKRKAVEMTDGDNAPEEGEILEDTKKETKKVIGKSSAKTRGKAIIKKKSSKVKSEVKDEEEE